MLQPEPFRSKVDTVGSEPAGDGRERNFWQHVTKTLPGGLCINDCTDGVKPVAAIGQPLQSRCSPVGLRGREKTAPDELENEGVLLGPQTQGENAPVNGLLDRVGQIQPARLKAGQPFQQIRGVGQDGVVVFVFGMEVSACVNE